MSDTFIQPYLFFGGRCEETLDFYQSAVGAQVDTVMRFSESAQPVRTDRTDYEYGETDEHTRPRTRPVL